MRPRPTDSLLQLAARLACAPRAVILDADHPVSQLAEFAVNIPLIARNGRHLGHLCLDPDKPLNENQAVNLRLSPKALPRYGAYP